jgi:hypothetical protein
LISLLAKAVFQNYFFAISSLIAIKYLTNNLKRNVSKQLYFRWGVVPENFLELDNIRFYDSQLRVQMAV